MKVFETKREVKGWIGALQSVAHMPDLFESAIRRVFGEPDEARIYECQWVVMFNEKEYNGDPRNLDDLIGKWVYEIPEDARVKDVLDVYMEMLHVYKDRVNKATASLVSQRKKLVC